jgi:hypothetical protein
MNYKILGADQKEYGPVTFDMLKQWIEQGRANSQTLTQSEGSAEWKPLGGFPEFAPFFIAKPPFTPPTDGQADPIALGNEVLARDYDLDMGACLSRAWALVKSDFWPIVGITALVLLIIGASGAVYVGIIVDGPLIGGLYFYYLKRIRGQFADLSDAFSGFSLFLPLFLGYLVSLLLTGVGFVCLILPGIYLIVAWMYALPLIIDKKIDFWPAMELSRKVISRHWWNFFGFMIVSMLINVLGCLACCIGVFVSAPVTMIAMMYAYEDIFRASGATAPQP